VEKLKTIMRNYASHLVKNFFAASLEQVATRDGFGKGVVEAGEKDARVVVLCGDLAESTRLHWFREKFPGRYIELGVAEQNLATVGSGLANYGKIPFIASYAVFSPGRNNEQIRTTISINNVPVKIAGCHAGVSVGPDGATHQALEDIALMRTQPNMAVVVPCDALEARKATLASVGFPGPLYLRFGREKSPVFTTDKTPFIVGVAEIFREAEKPDVALVACGILVYKALQAADELAKEGIGATVVNNHTVKPLDAPTLARVAEKAGAVVTIEEHQVAGGMGSAVAELLVRECPVPMEFIGVHDAFGQSGTPDELIEHYGMGVEAIKAAARRAVQRKK
jgi:transketolase